ncbi:NAD(P)H-hydrate dehydratase [Moraxella osloensis]|uniref:ADP-dependent (S)-NAD(P)H-hydrate dehydratase n=1 Tax=Faucicola osloensis TaxID=34062 RepID=A0A2D2LU91_FAUOS|nr:NAD(P)H-hydrate dehydratase [Moraxella osloensis]ATR78595.1 bifunctional ADP-dependent NAD(P)H-hydrate dehydratase/NAD(P)H-hydrate epimerase [Moraxella osloensis]
MQSNAQTDKNTVMPNAIALYSPKQIYDLEKNWFSKNDSFALMQQAAWQLAHIIKQESSNQKSSYLQKSSHPQKSVLVVAGAGNNGGDAWLVAHYINQLCPHWSVSVVQVAAPSTLASQTAKHLYQSNCANAAKYLTLTAFLQPIHELGLSYHYDVVIDGLLGIGLNRKPTGDYQTIINWINQYRKQVHACQVISIDVPSGLNAATGEVYDDTAVKADKTLCLIGRKVGLHMGGSKDYVGTVIDVPLLPVEPSGMLLHCTLPNLPQRQQVSHKGTYGHVLIIGGNRLQDGHGMAGAAILAASAALSSGAGKVTVACHGDFHAAIVTALPNAMTADLHNVAGIIELINAVDVVAIGMGLGRDKVTLDLFNQYLTAIKQSQKLCVIDADGLYHLADWAGTSDGLTAPIQPRLGQSNQRFYLTPHSAEAGRLLNQPYADIDRDKISAIRALAHQYGGNWLIKGAQTIVLERDSIDICGLGNAGMATAGMGDCLAGLMASLLAQAIAAPMLTAVLIHAKAGDTLAEKMGEYALQANHMASAIGDIIHQITDD